MNDDASTFAAGDYLRRLRRSADLSQRQLAAASGVALSTISRIESGHSDPRVGILQRMLDQTNWRLTVVDTDDALVLPLAEFRGDLRDGAGRRFPAHLDVIVDPVRGEWWGDRYGLARPPETFHRSRPARDRQREISQITLGQGRFRRS